jgi:hypothetical protein
MSKQCPNCGSWSDESKSIRISGSKVPYLLPGLGLIGLGVGVVLVVVGFQQFVTSSGTQLSTGHCGAGLIFISGPFLIWYFLYHRMSRVPLYTSHTCSHCGHTWIA